MSCDIKPSKPLKPPVLFRRFFGQRDKPCLFFGGGGFFSSHILPVTNNIHCNRYVALSEGTEIGLKYILKLKSDMSFHFHLFVPP